MIINSAPQNEAVLSNVGEIGEFRIRNSAKAFSILSSGLYANKVRAIIRELSCNAVDSHTAAGKQDTPFDVHLPNTLEPWFSIRDYGTGLSHEQVTQIYTTYFESTKTASNEFIGALGLGSKSPFSYTDNFTVTAIQNGVKGIYSAFINAAGVPSIAQMMTEATDEPAGVEVKFSVNDRYDFDKFRQEARHVYTYFKLRPVVSGSAGFEFINVAYDTENIIPGVHSYKDSRRSIAIMGNIAYPIDIPQADTSLGDLRNLLNYGLEIHFAIGELDFQASREGLSYIPQTVASIKAKVEAVNTALAVVIAKEADAIDNLWERAHFLNSKKRMPLWQLAVVKYATDTKLVTVDSNAYGVKKFSFSVEDLAKQYNITIRAFSTNHGSSKFKNISSNNEMSSVKDANGWNVYTPTWYIEVDKSSYFIINDTKVGVVERANHHYKETKDNTHRIVKVLEAADKTKPMNTSAFFKAIATPPESIKILGSALTVKVRAAGMAKNVTILSLQERNAGGYYRAREMVWRDAGKADAFDANTTFYYLPLSGFNVISDFQTYDTKQLYNDLKLCGLNTLAQTTIYGVRKGDMPFIKTQKNWVNLETFIAGELAKIDSKLTMSLVIQAVDNFNLLSYNSNIVYHVKATDSDYIKLVTQFKGYDKVKYSEQSLKNLCRAYAKGVTFNPQATVDLFVQQCTVIQNKYPLLQYLRSAPSEEVGNYINLIDASQKEVV